MIVININIVGNGVSSFPIIKKRMVVQSFPKQRVDSTEGGSIFLFLQQVTKDLHGESYFLIKLKRYLNNEWPIIK